MSEKKTTLQFHTYRQIFLFYLLKTGEDIGSSRLVMMLTTQHTIFNALLFHAMKSETIQKIPKISVTNV